MEEEAACGRAGGRAGVPQVPLPAAPRAPDPVARLALVLGLGLARPRAGRRIPWRAGLGA